ncbi:MAG: tripartite tricarboxylate transporter TctB family protein [Pseudomonadota bacterium]
MADRLLGAVCVIVAAAMAWFARSYTAEISYEPVGPRAFPTLLAALMGLAGLWLLLRPRRFTPAAPASTEPQAPPNLRAVALCAVAVLAYGAVFQALGFWLATAAMTVPVALAFGGRWHKALAGGLVMGLGLYFLFDKLLDVILPTGVMAFLLGGR